MDRTQGELGVCHAPAELRLGRAALHWWEEPCLVGDRGSGAVFFSYCSLRCIYCQNYDLAVVGSGVSLSEERFAEVLLRLQNEEYAANINLVTPSQYVPTIARVLHTLKSANKLNIPVVYNTSGYERVSSLQGLEGLVDCYLADFKYVSSRVASELSHAPDYPRVALRALEEMVRQVGEWKEDDTGLLQQGVIVRHLVLPGHVDESLRVLKVLDDHFSSSIRLSIMSQYTPVSNHLSRYGLDRTLTSEEYEQVLDYADGLGIQNYYWQEGSSATESFIPVFDGTGV